MNKKELETVGAPAYRCPNKGITLIALIITIIVMLILVAVTISMAINGGLFEKAGQAVGEMQNATNYEKELSNRKIEIGGIWYDSIDDYLAGIPSSSVKINLSIAGTKETTIPIPSGFRYKEGTIDTGYVIINETDGNEFVWVPVEKNQKITLKITSEKDVIEVKLYDPQGDEILTVTDGEIETTYNNANINPTINGMYTAKVTTEDGIVWKKLTVRSLYAINSKTPEEYAILEGYSSKQEMYQAWADEDYDGSIDAMLEDWGYTSIEECELLAFAYPLDYEDLADYTESVNSNGGFYIARYEAGAETARTSSNSSDTVETIKTANGTPVSQEGYVPYNRVTFDQALGLAESMYSSSNFEVSLLTGSAWDRTLGWIYETGSKSIKEIVGDSGKWGNYKDVEFEIGKGRYSEDNGSSYTAVSGTYTKDKEKSVLLTTGATTRNSVNNIFDLAGNVDEWTNEFDTFSNNFIHRGGSCELFSAVEQRVGSSNGYGGTSHLSGFRAAIYINFD